MHIPDVTGLSMYDAAMAYAIAGLHVFPIDPVTGLPFPGSRGHLDATNDIDELESLLGQYDSYGLAIRCIDILAIDVDKPELNVTLVDDVNATTCPSGRTRRGIHALFEDLDNKYLNTAGKIPGVDTRTKDGWIRVAPTIHPISGEPYEWIRTGVIKPMPPKLEKTMRPYLREKPVDDEVNSFILGSSFELPDFIPDGQRHDIVYRYACSLRARGVMFTDAVRAMKQLLPRIESTPRRPYELSDAIRELDQAWTLDGPSARLQSTALQADTDEPDLAEIATSEFRDMSWILLTEDEWPVPPPGDLLTRSDGQCLFYRGRVNGIYGAPESGKTWIALAAIVEEVKQGGFAVFVDIDHNGGIQIGLWLAALGLEPASIADPARFRLYEPSGAAEYRETMKQLIDEKPTVLVVDSIGELLPMLGLKSLDNDEVRRGLRPLALFADETGCCVITVDHITKDAGNTKYAIGAGGKKAMVNGSYVYVDVVVQPAPGRTGKLKLGIEKDRLGGVRAGAVGDTWAVVVMDSTGHNVDMVVEVPGSEANIMADYGAEQKQLILNAIAADPSINKQGLAKTLNVSLKTIQRYTTELERDELLIIHREPGVSAHYEIVVARFTE